MDRQAWRLVAGVSFKHFAQISNDSLKLPYFINVAAFYLRVFTQFSTFFQVILFKNAVKSASPGSTINPFRIVSQASCNQPFPSCALPFLQYNFKRSSFDCLSVVDDDGRDDEMLKEFSTVRRLEDNVNASENYDCLFSTSSLLIIACQFWSMAIDLSQNYADFANYPNLKCQSPLILNLRDSSLFLITSIALYIYLPTSFYPFISSINVAAWTRSPFHAKHIAFLIDILTNILLKQSRSAYDVEEGS